MRKWLVWSWVFVVVAVCCAGISVGLALTGGKGVTVATYAINSVTWTVLALTARNMARL